MLNKLFLSIALLVASVASAAEGENTFAKKGSSVLQIQYGAKVAGTGAGVTSTQPGLTSPSFDYFIFDNVSVGGQFTYGYDNTFKNGDTKASRHQLSVGPRIGYAARLTDVVSVWPRVGLNYGMNKEGDAVGSATNHGLELEVSAPVNFHVHKNVFLATGPQLNVDLVNKTKASTKGDVSISATTNGTKTVSFGWTAAIGFNF